MKDRKDVDINPKGVSPKVPEVQGAPDGRSAGAKKDEEASPGVKAAKGLDADEEKKKDEEEKAKKDAEEKEKKDKEEKEDGDEKKEDAEDLKKQLDAMTAKCDALEEKLKGDTQISPPVSGKPSGAPQFDRKDSKDFKAAVQARVSLERTAGRLVSPATAEKFDAMSDDEIRTAVILARQPKADLKGKSTAYLESRFDSISELYAESESVRRGMGGSLMQRFDNDDAADPVSARQKAHSDSKDAWKEPLSASKKH